jgi:cytochrome b6
MERSVSRPILQRTATLMAVSIVSLCLLAAITGFLLAFYYEPTAGGAHDSLEMISSQIPAGTLILSLHNRAGNLVILLALIQLVVMFLGRQFKGSWLTGWFSGIFLALAVIGLSWTAIPLDWDQTGFWRFKVELSIIESIPLAGGTIRQILTGGGGINSTTLQHMYSLHSYVAAIAALLLAVVHLTSLILQENTWASQRLRQAWAALRQPRPKSVKAAERSTVGNGGAVTPLAVKQQEADL